MSFLRTLKQRFGISAPRVAVRTHVAWYWRWLGMASVLGFAAIAGWVALHTMMLRESHVDAAGLDRFNKSVERQQQEMAELRARATRAERQMAIERATSEDLARQIKALTEHNAALKEDLTFFQTLMPAGGGTSGIIIDRFKVEKEVLPGEYRYRFFLVQTGKRERNFEGRLQFVVSIAQNDGFTALTLPAEGERDIKDYRVDFKFFQRVEGTFRVDPRAVVKTFQVRVFENGSKTPRLAQTVHTS
jgi:uncharacterized protein DUF6776